MLLAKQLISRAERGIGQTVSIFHIFVTVKFFFIVYFQKTSIPTPKKVIGNSMGEGGFKRNDLKG